MSSDVSWLSGQLVRAVQREAYSWHFSFSDGSQLTAECPWRIIADHAVALGSVDHHQKFGLPQNVDAAKEAESLLESRKISEALIRPETCDLIITFERGVRLELFNGSAGYEGWNLGAPDGRLFVAQGGGQLALV